MVYDLQPILERKLLRLRPIRPEDWDDLYGVASDPLIWEQHPHNDRYKEEEVRRAPNPPPRIGVGAPDRATSEARDSRQS